MLRTVAHTTCTWNSELFRDETPLVHPLTWGKFCSVKLSDGPLKLLVLDKMICDFIAGRTEVLCMALLALCVLCV